MSDWSQDHHIFDLLQTYSTNKSRGGVLSLSIVLTAPDLWLGTENFLLLEEKLIAP
jgi:hypothetical protein